MGQGAGRVAAIAAAAALCVALDAGHAQAGGGGFGGGTRRTQVDVQSLVERQLQQSVGFTNEEWSVIEPRWWRVVSLQLALGKGPMVNLAQNSQRYAGRPSGNADILSRLQAQEDPAVVKMAEQFRLLGEQLQALIRNESAGVEQLQIKLTEYRAERFKLEEALATAQRELRSVLTLRQESWMVLADYLN